MGESYGKGNFMDLKRKLCAAMAACLAAGALAAAAPAAAMADACSHQWKQTAYEAPTCAKGGMVEKTCIKCGAMTGKGLGATGKHKYKKVTVKAKKCAAGYKGKKCKTCGKVVKTKVLKAKKAHKWAKVSVEATCTAAGYTAKKCKVCGALKVKKATAKLGHDWLVKTGKAATCTEAGVSDLKRCLRCGKETGGEEIAATGHHWEKKTDAVAATCTQKGKGAVIACSRCGEEKGGEETDALGHDYSGGKCSRCGEAAPSQEHEHTYGWVVEKEATCRLSAIGEYKCTVCGAHPESYPEGIYPGQSFVGKPLGHDYSVYVTAYDGDCSNNARAYVTCSRCGEYQDFVNENGEKELVQVDAGVRGPHSIQVSKGGEYSCYYCGKSWGKTKPTEEQINETAGKPGK